MTEKEFGLIKHDIGLITREAKTSAATIIVSEKSVSPNRTNDPAQLKLNPSPTLPVGRTYPDATQPLAIMSV
jgi:hypothetical protein